MLIQVWLKVKEQDAVYRAFYTGKTDLDAAFFPGLRVH